LVKQFTKVQKHKMQVKIINRKHNNLKNNKIRNKVKVKRNKVKVKRNKVKVKRKKVKVKRNQIKNKIKIINFI